METNALARAITSKSPTKLSAASAISPAKNVMVLQRIAQIAVRQQIECSINRIIHAIATQDIIQFPINLCARHAATLARLVLDQRLNALLAMRIIKESRIRRTQLHSIVFAMMDSTMME